MENTWSMQFLVILISVFYSNASSYDFPLTQFADSRSLKSWFCDDSCPIGEIVHHERYRCNHHLTAVTTMRTVSETALRAARDAANLVKIAAEAVKTAATANAKKITYAVIDCTARGTTPNRGCPTGFTAVYANNLSVDLLKCLAQAKPCTEVGFASGIGGGASATKCEVVKPPYTGLTEIDVEDNEPMCVICRAN